MPLALKPCTPEVLCLNLTSCVDWDGFPAYAETVIGLQNGKIEKSQIQWTFALGKFK